MKQAEFIPEQREKLLRAFEERVVSAEVLRSKFLNHDNPNWPSIFSQLKERTEKRINRFPPKLQASIREIVQPYFDIEEDLLIWKRRNIAEEATEEVAEGLPVVGSRALKGMLKNVGNEPFWHFFETMLKIDRDKERIEQYKKIRLRGFFNELLAQKALTRIPALEMLPTTAEQDARLGIDFIARLNDKIFIGQVKGRQLEQSPKDPQCFMVPERIIEIIPKEGPGGWEQESIYLTAPMSKKEPTEEQMKTPFAAYSPFKMSSWHEQQALKVTETLLEENEVGRYIRQMYRIEDVISEHLRREMKMIISEKEAERVKGELRSAMETGMSSKVEISGVDFSGAPKKIDTTSNKVREWISRISKEFFEEKTNEVHDYAVVKIYVDNKVRSKLARDCRNFSKRQFQDKRVFGLVFWAPYIVQERKDEFFINEKGEFIERQGIQIQEYLEKQLKQLENL